MSQPTSLSRTRIHSIDAARGFATLWAFLSQPIVPALQQLTPSSWRDFLITQLTHSREQGFTFLDWGYPTFLLLIGVSSVLSLEKHKASARREEVLWKVLRRTLFMFCFAFFLYGGFSNTWEETPGPTVFHAIALCIFLSGIIELYFSNRGIAALLLMLWIGHGMILLLSPDYSGLNRFTYVGSAQYHWERTFSEWWESFIDPRYFRGISAYYMLIQWRQFESCLCGLLMGRFLLSQLTIQQKLIRLAIVGFAGVDIGLLLSSFIPIHKMLWTPSYAILAAGLTCWLIAFFMLIADYRGHHSWTTFFVVFGRYPLVAWATYHLVPFRKYAEILAGTMVAPYFGEYHSLFLSLLEIFLCWLPFYWIYRNNLSLKWNALPRPAST